MIRSFITLTSAAVFGLISLPAWAALPTVTLYKNKQCECCTAWAHHLEAAGFTVKTVSMDDVTPVKDRLGVPQKLRVCHTAQAGAYTLEGHVPADLVAKGLKDKPRIAGLATPGMPIGSPGMEAPGAKPQPYSVMAYTRSGNALVYARR
ncbi:DUF411 domain-containing protein [Crenobacter cavernae]|uniref:DUF411 domain-containing protein n=1 Tax=Crenobacter cavernae TaxID=2290923 RepID=A0A345Y423_9NEIS|nr:DUF411 domain-containing protein [Crenobacter cavernae]AXK38675.1 DUF411 domain-containing protein [Crenobacter cavernae]